MVWSKLLSWLKIKKPSLPSYQDLDKKLVKSTQTSQFPKLAQFKYIKHFLSTTEKKTALASLFVFVVSGMTLAGLQLAQRIEQVPTVGGEYSEAMIGQPKYINPLFAAASDVDADLTSLIYDGLFRYNQDEKLEPDLAESYTISADQKSYDITIRPGRTWSDGEPVTIDDVIFTFETLQNPEVGSPLLLAFQDVLITKVNDTTVRFTLKSPYAPFMSSLTVGILPTHIWGSISANSLKLAGQNLQPIGSGAWKFSKLLKDESGRVTSYTLERNESYQGKKPYISTLRFVFFDEYREAVDAMRTDTSLSLSFVPHALENKLNSKTVKIIPITLPQYTSLFYNQTNQPLLKDDALREALALATNKEQLVRDALGNYGKVIDYPILEGSIGYIATSSKLGFSIEQANALLDKKWTRIQPEDYFTLATTSLFKKSQPEIEAFKQANSSTPEKGIEFETQLRDEAVAAVRKAMDPSQTFYRKDKDGVILEISLTTADNPEYSRTAELIARMWQEAGIKVNVQKINTQQIVQVVKKRNYETLLYGELIGFDPDPFPFWHSSQVTSPGLNVANYSNRTADKLLEEARATTDEKKRGDLYRQFQEILAKDMPALFLYTPTYSFAVSTNIKGVTNKTINTPADRFIGIEDWYEKTTWRFKR